MVDDEEAIVESIAMTLEDDYRVFTALSGKEGLEILEREDVALVIVDQVMPDMSGVEFLEKVVERRPRTVRMMLTGYADISSIVRAINDGRIYRYIQKPWEPESLRIDVRRALEAHALLDRERPARRRAGRRQRAAARREPLPAPRGGAPLLLRPARSARARR